MEEKIKMMRQKTEQNLKENSVTYYEWKRIEDYINSKYETINEKSTL